MCRSVARLQNRVETSSCTGARLRDPCLCADARMPIVSNWAVPVTALVRRHVFNDNKGPDNHTPAKCSRMQRFPCRAEQPPCTGTYGLRTLRCAARGNRGIIRRDSSDEERLVPARVRYTSREAERLIFACVQDRLPAMMVQTHRHDLPPESRRIRILRGQHEETSCSSHLATTPCHTGSSCADNANF